MARACPAGPALQPERNGQHVADGPRYRQGDDLMLPRFIASQAWVERQSLSPEDLVWLGNSDADFAGAVPARDGDRCPQCGRHPNEPEFQVPVPDSAASTPERVTGRAYVG